MVRYVLLRRLGADVLLGVADPAAGGEFLSRTGRGGMRNLMGEETARTLEWVEEDS